MNRKTILILTLNLYCLSLVSVRADDAVSELALADDFRPSALEGIPRSDSLTGLRIDRREYQQKRAFEWELRLQAPSDQPSPLYVDVDSADFIVKFPSANPITLHWNKGSHAEITDFQPREELLNEGKPFSLESFGGRSSDGVMPYFNLAGEKGGLILAVGWPGDWKAEFESLGDGRVRVVAGLKRFRFRLRAGESVRLPSVLLMSYRGEWTDGQNQFRRLMLHHFTPTNHPPLDLMPVAASVHGMIGFNDTTEANLTALARDIAALNLPLDTFWLDAGWNVGGFPQGQGNPQADASRFPLGLAPVGSTVRNTGMRFLMWFEPERAMRGTWLAREHADWLLTPTQTPSPLQYMEKDGFLLLDLGNADAREWAIETISQEIGQNEISVYRQDFNEYPAYFWHTNEPKDEIGLREVRYINGLYDFLDELARRHPALVIDNCASGGRRLDFEMMRRSVVLWRSDSCWDDRTFPRNMQAMTHGLSHWLPLHGVGALTTDDVALRSGMGTCASYAINYRDPKAVAALRNHLSRYLKVRSLFAADFYPLTEWSDDPNRWLAFQFHDPKKNEGIVQAFCQVQTNTTNIPLKLKGLDPTQKYLVTDWDDLANPIKRTGAELVNIGIDLTARERLSQAVVLQYRVDK